MSTFHFLRPGWFFALLPLAFTLALLWRRHNASRSWEAVVDSGLLPFLLVGSGRKRGAWPLAAVALGGVLAITALAGPVWKKLEQPVFRSESALVVLLDLSRSMEVADLPPSRLQMARFKLRDILARRKEGSTALVVYAADPFPVTPLTDDVDNITRQLSSLTPDLMPAQGSRADRAIAQAQALLQQAGAVHGDVLLITDGVENTPAGPLQKVVATLRSSGYRLSVLGVGTPDGAPIPQPGGGFFKDANGAIVLPRLDDGALRHVAEAGGGIYRRLVSDDSDTDALTGLFNGSPLTQKAQKMQGMKSDQWREEGPWLLLPLLLLSALAFRRGYLLMLPFFLLLPMPHAAYAVDWNGLWQRPDQQAAQAFAAQQPRQAARLFTDPQWRAAAHYRAGDYGAVVNDLKDRHSAVDDYNRGNALAHLGRFPEALNAYEEALRTDPGFADARHNRNLVKHWMQQPPSAQKSGTGDDGKGSGDKRSGGQSRQGAQGKQGSRENAQQQAQGQQQQGSQGKPQQGNGREPQPSPQGKPQQGTQGEQQQGNRGEGKDGGNGTESSANPDGRNPTPPQSGASSLPPSSKEGATADGNRASSQSTQSPYETDTANPPHQSESAQATEQWLRRIPDDPGGLWRRKFLYQYQRQDQSQGSEAKPW